MGRKKKLVENEVENLGDDTNGAEESEETPQEPVPSPEKLELEQLYSLMKKYGVNSISDVENKLSRY